MRLIDAEQFKHKINNSELYDSEEWVKVLDILADCDSIDAVPVVRCKDCVHFAMFKDSVEKAGICKIGYGYCIENNFCSYGVRKDDSN